MGLRGRSEAGGKKARRAAKDTGKDSAAVVETEVAKAEPATSGRGPLTPAGAKRVIGIGKVVAPLLAPYALAAAGAARGQWDIYRARKLGVAIDELSTYTGRGGALHARISRIAETLTRLDDGEAAHADGSARTFVADTRPRLADLSVAIRAAEQMPSARRRTAFRAVSGELDRIEGDLLTHLGIRA